MRQALVDSAGQSVHPVQTQKPRGPENGDFDESVCRRSAAGVSIDELQARAARRDQLHEMLRAIAMT